MAKRRNISRKKLIWIGSGLALVAVAAGGIVVHRRRAAAPGGGAQGSGGPDGSAPWYVQYQTQLRKLCRKPSSLTLEDREALIDGVFLPAWRTYRATHLPSGPLEPQQLQNAREQVAQAVVAQSCQQHVSGTAAAAISLASGARLRDEGLSGQ